MSLSDNSHNRDLERDSDDVEFALTPQQVPAPQKPRKARATPKQKPQPQPRPLTISDAVALGPVACLQALFGADNVIYMTSNGRKTAAELRAQQKGKRHK